MKAQTSSLAIAFCSVVALFIFNACVNRISDQNDPLDENDLQFSFRGTINSSATSRVVGNQFEAGDSVGLFALVNSAQMTDERYIDNISFHYSSNDKFITDIPTFYPDEDENLTLYSYYPFQKSGIKTGKSEMNVEVKSDQSLKDNFSNSDFLVAHSKNQSAIEKDISLVYNHQFTKLMITLVSQDPEKIKEIANEKIELFICGFYTKADYDFTSGSFQHFRDIKNITPYGNWIIEKGKLTGKAAIFIPQQLTDKDQYLILKINGKQYISYFPDQAKFLSGGAYELKIKYTPSEDYLISDINNSIKDWDDMDNGNTETHLIHTYVNVADLSFDKSNVYDVIYQGNTVAKICKEYLLAENIASQAIVAYPMKDGKTDLKNGLVLQVIGNEDARLHGGKVEWNTLENKLNYTPGNRQSIKQFYITASGAVSADFSKDVLPVWCVADRLKDVRGKMVTYYPIVKIGTQFWMRENLKTSMYLDGKVITKMEDVNNDREGYLQPEKDGFCFYNAALALSDHLIPAGWVIPQNSDWGLLMSYLNHDAALLKSGVWKIMNHDSDKEIQGSNNQTGFNAYPVGMCFNKIYSAYRNVLVLYWTMSDANHTLSDRNLGFMSTDAKEVYAPCNTDKALSIRCLKK